MRRILWTLALSWGWAMGALWAAQGTVQTGPAVGNSELMRQAEQAMALVLAGNGSGQVVSVSAGVVVRPDGILLTAYRPLKGAPELQVRLRDGEVFDRVDLVGFDERRDVAALHIPASGLAAPALAAPEQDVAGEPVRVVTANQAIQWSTSDGLLGPVRLADELSGAGNGYHIVPFMAPLLPGAVGGALFNSRAALVGIITSQMTSAGQQFAVPVASVAGLSSQGLHAAFGNGSDMALPAATPGSAPAPGEPVTPITALAMARTVRVTSTTVYFTPFMLEKELMSNAEFRALGINFMDDGRRGDLLVSVTRPLFTYDFTFAVSDTHSGIVLATDKVTAIDGPHAAEGIAKKLVQELEKARAVLAARSSAQPAESGRF